MRIVPHEVIGRETDLGDITVTAEAVTAYAAAVGDATEIEVPPTFCLALHPGLTPEVPLPPDHFGVYGGHDIEWFQPLRVGHSYRRCARIAAVYEKSGRSGSLTVVEREIVVSDTAGATVVRILERQIVRKRPPQAAASRR